MFRFLPTNIRALTASFDSKIADVGNRLVHSSADTYDDRVLTTSPYAKLKGGNFQQPSRGHRTGWPSRLDKSLSSLISIMLSDTLTEFFRDFPKL